MSALSVMAAKCLSGGDYDALHRGWPLCGRPRWKV